MENVNGSRSWRRVMPVVVILGLAAAAAGAVVLSGGVGHREVTIPSGTRLVVALENTLSTETHRVGDRVKLQLAESLELDGETVLASGALVHAEVGHAKGGGRIAGAPELMLHFTALEVEGESHAIQAQPFWVRGNNDAAESAATVGGGAVAGGVLGGVVGGKDDILKGAAAGAVIGTGVAVATKGDQIVLPAGQRLRVVLTGPVTVRSAPKGPEERGGEE